MVGIPYVSWKARTKWSELALDAESWFLSLDALVVKGAGIPSG